MKIIKVKVFTVDELPDYVSKKKAVGIIKEFYTSTDFLHNDLTQMCIKYLGKLGITITDLDIDFRIDPDQILIKYLEFKKIAVKNKAFLSHMLSHDMYTALEKRFPGFKNLTVSVARDYTSVVSTRPNIFPSLDSINAIENFSLKKHLESKLYDFFKELTSNEAMFMFAKSAPDSVFYFYENGEQVDSNLLD